MIDARISVGLPAHPKTKKLIRRVGEGGAWRLVCLFLWVAQSHPDGDLAGMTGEDVELAADWQGEEGAFIKALIEVGFVDGEEGAYSIHDWEEHNPWAAGADARSEKAKWLALCKHHGRSKAAEMMPEFASRLRGDAESKRDARAEDASSSAECSSAAPCRPATSMRVAENSSAPSPSPSPSTSEQPSVRAEQQEGSPAELLPAVADATPPPKAPRAETALQVACRETWGAYCQAYAARYGAAPVRAAKQSSQVKQIVQALGAEEAPQVAAWFVEHPAQWYVTKGHDIGLLLSDLTKLRTEWATGRVVTSTAARHSDRRGAMASALQNLLAECEGGQQ